jgi:GH15 family glucan-1,4-alpha-glucosidase
MKAGGSLRAAGLLLFCSPARRVALSPASARDERFGVSQHIAQHGVIGDCRSAALVAADGTIDWLCWPRFDSPALFAALVDDGRKNAGLFRLAPAGGWSSVQRYAEDTNVLQTAFTHAHNVVLLTDVMAVSGARRMHEELIPEHEILRLITCERGSAEIELELQLAPGFGLSKFKVHQVASYGLRADSRAGSFIIRSEAPLQVDERGVVRSRFVLHAGETVRVSLSYSSEAPAVLPLLGAHADEAVAASVRFWRQWAARCTYRGPWRSHVVRSALALKLLTYTPSGAMVAAATSSLPEVLGGELNWDYRYCWIRDASFTARALIGLGYVEEAAAFIYWMLHFTELSHPRLRVLYDVFGERPKKERRLEHFRGYRGSRPVRVGNAADGQLQLDLYGELTDAVHSWVQAGGELDRSTEAELIGFGNYVCENWMVPDQGIWEPREHGRHHTHSRLMCWTALDRLIRLRNRGMLGGLDVSKVSANRGAIRADIETRGWNEQLQSYVGVLDSNELDSAVLVLPWYEFEPATSPRMKRTLQTVWAALGAGRAGLLYRNQLLRQQGEGAFVLCGFWATELLADGGEDTRMHAIRLFDRLLQNANGVGLMSEELDPHTNEFLGNFPQAFSHVGLINCALTLEENAARYAEMLTGSLRRPTDSCRRVSL